MRKSKAKRFGALPSAAGVLTKLACMRARAAGIELDPLLRQAGLTRRQVDDARLRISVQSQIKFLNIAANALRDEFLGAHLAWDFDLREIGLTYYVMASSETLGDALRRMERYSTMGNEGIALKYLEGKDIAIVFDYVGVARHSDRHQIEGWTTALVRACRQLTNRRVLPTRVKFIRRRSEDCSELTRLLGRGAVFGADADEVAFSATVKDMPLVGADRHLNELLTTYCEEALARRRTDRGALRSQVENALVPLLPHGTARADADCPQARHEPAHAGAPARVGRVDVRRNPGRLAIGSRQTLFGRRAPHHFANRVAARLPGSERLHPRLQAVDRQDAEGNARVAGSRARVSLVKLNCEKRMTGQIGRSGFASPMA